MKIKRRKFIIQTGLGTIGAGAVIYLPGCRKGTLSVNAAGLFSPESQSVSSRGILQFFDAVEKSGLEFHSIMINRNGKTILEGWWHPFKKEYVHTLYSLCHTFFTDR